MPGAERRGQAAVRDVGEARQSGDGPWTSMDVRGEAQSREEAQGSRVLLYLEGQPPSEPWEQGRQQCLPCALGL